MHAVSRMPMFRLIALVMLAVAATQAAHAQSPGEPVPTGRATEPETVRADTLFLFTPARPLIDSTASAEHYDEALGFDVLFSNSGFGVGGFYQRPITDKLAWFVN